ncbi:MFS general substrate transporter [Flagelloscypha sp. PMI_526]|nr:MFS general substrate transporter [Flagelloscypha sp. PMI_526]
MRHSLVNEKVEVEDEHVLTDQSNLGLPFRTLLTIFLGLSGTVFVASVDAVVVAAGLPTVSSSLNAGSVISWVPSAYLLTSTIFQPMIGRLSDIFGRKLVLCLSIAVFAIGNLVSGFMENVIALIVFRGVAGAGGGGMVSLIQIIVSDIVSLRERGKYQGYISAVVAIGFLVGPVLGGALAQHAGWQWVFWITVPLSVISLLIVIFFLPLKPVKGSMLSKVKAIDYFGCLMALGTATMFLLPIIWGGITFPWNSPLVIGPLAAGVVAMIIFCLWEWKGAKLPIIPMHIFMHGTVVGVFIAMFINGFITYSSVYYLPEFFQIRLKMDPTHAGIFLIPLLICQLAAGWIAGLVITKTGHYRMIVWSGFAMWAIGCGLLSMAKEATPKSLIAVYMVLSGLGAGQTQQTTTVAAQASVERQEMSVVTAFRNFCRNLGGALGLAIGGTIINTSLQNTLSSITTDSAILESVINDPSQISLLLPPDAQVKTLAAFDGGFRLVFIINASLAAFGFIISMLLIQQKNLEREDDRQVGTARNARSSLVENGRWSQISRV